MSLSCSFLFIKICLELRLVKLQNFQNFIRQVGILKIHFSAGMFASGTFVLLTKMGMRELRPVRRLGCVPFISHSVLNHIMKGKEFLTSKKNPFS